MEGFKKSSKVACYKEGGQVGYTSRRAGKEAHPDIVEDKKLIKKAFKQHDSAKHEGTEPTEIKLKKGGRTKKAVGTVKKYKCGGGVKKMAEGKTTGEVVNAEPIGLAPVSNNIKNILKNAGSTLKTNVMGTEKQNADATKSLDKVAQGQGALSDVERGIRSITGKKRGGKC